MNMPRRSFYHQKKEKSPDKALEDHIADMPGVFRLRVPESHLATPP